MKRTIIIFTVLFTTFLTCYGQFFIEGNLGVSYGINKRENAGNIENRTSELILGVSPKVGYWLNDRMAAGVCVSYNSSNKTNSDLIIGQEEPVLGNSFTSLFGFAVFGRYRLFYIKKLSVLVESSLGINRGTVKYKLSSTTLDTSSLTSIDIKLYPVISYDLTDRYSILTILDFASLGFSTGSSKNELTGIKNNGSSFGFNAGSTILNSLSDVSVGFIYKF